MERKRIIINFKNTPDDIKLYEEIKKHSCISGYVKDALRGIVFTNISGKVPEIKQNDDDIEIDINLDDINDIIGG